MPVASPILMIKQDESYAKNKVKGLTSEGKEITFPSGGTNSSAPVVIKAKIFGREVNRVHMDGGSSCEEKNLGLLENSSGNHDRIAMQKIGIVVSTIQGALKFHTTKGIGTVFSTYESDKVKEGMKKIIETPPASEKGELTKAGILQKVKHQTWIANTVMVNKSDEGWRMCVDFTDINKACPKDCYPLPKIDWKVESLSGFRLKCFLDAYKGYHQIQMTEEDEDKTAFFTGEEVFCYRKMPFGLKNAIATYQRLVDKVFYDQIGRNLEAYVNDMVIKRMFEEEMLADIKETFERFRSINMKLNPKKCSFGVEEGPFLGYLITKQWIRAKPSKVKAITDVEQLKTYRASTEK
ncbi:reverse transcriptase domain-containing protein [Tanacetum coccineum]|uniref:Reverse transcriptase domain-containing protein n=1 Tax=Tanacetum coccineum TaxID=301880 RepID=A0ABQ5H4F6_9ASTR